MDSIKPSINLDGQTYYPPGWMWTMGFALGGCQWAIDIVSTPEFREKVIAHLKEERNDAIKSRIKYLQKEIDTLIEELDQSKE